MSVLQSIGIFGGSFDPVHNGHVLVARAALEELSLDRLFIVPAARSPFKPEQKPAAADVRLRLLRLLRLLRRPSLFGYTYTHMSDTHTRTCFAPRGLSGSKRP